MRPTLPLIALLALASVARGEELRTDRTIEGSLTDARISGSADGENPFFVPGENELEFAWSDEPVVAHVPFVVDAPAGEPVWIVISVGFDGFDGDGKGYLAGKDEIRWNAGAPDGPGAAVGISRHDGTDWHDGIQIVGDESYRLIREPGEGMPVAPWREMDGGRPAGAHWLRLLRVEAGEGIVGKTSRLVIHIPPDAPRGSYTLWFVVPSAYIWSTRAWTQPEEITGEFRAVVFSIQQEEEPDYHELMVAAGERPQTSPDDPNLSRWKRLPDVTVPVTCRSNGWVLDKSWVRPESGPEKVDRTLTGRQGTFQGRAVHSREGWAFTTGYRVTFPERIQDESVFDIRIEGNLAVHEDESGLGGPWEFELVQEPSYFAEQMEEIGLPRECWEDREGRGKYHSSTPLFDDEKGRRGPGPKTIEEVRRDSPRDAPFWEPPNDWGGDRPGAREGVLRLWMGPPPAGRHGALSDLGPYALFHMRLSWVGEIVQTYRRRSEVESNHKGAPRAVEAGDPKATTYRDDGFEEWFQRYCPAVAEAHKVLNAAESKATAIGAAVAVNRKHLPILRESASVESEHRSEDARIRIRHRVGLLEREVRDDLARLADTVKEAEAAVEEVRALLAEQEKRSAEVGRRREQLVRWRKEWDDRKFQTALELCLKGEDYEALDAQANERDLSALEPRHQWELANIYLNRGRVARATFVMRSLVFVAPHSLEAEMARGLISRLEAKILRAVSGKISGEVAEARKKFFDWLESRGISQEEPVGLLARGFEKYWTILSTGPGAFASWAAGRMEGMEGESRSIQEAGTGIWLGLKAMEALAERGTTLAEMDAGLDAGELRIRLHLERAGRVYTDADYAALGAQIRSALALPEIRALIDGNERMFEVELADASFDLDSVDFSESRADSWEYRFDLFSAKNTAMLLLPMSVGSIGGKLVPLSWRPWGFTEATNALKAARMLGHEVRTGQELLAAAIGWESALASLSTSKVGLRISQELELIHASGGYVWKATWGASPLLADLAIATGVVHLADKYGGPHIAAAAEAVVYTFLWDPALMSTLLKRARTTPAMLERLAKRYGREVAWYEREMVRTREHLMEMQQVLRQERLDPKRIRELRKLAPKPPPTEVAPPSGGNPAPTAGSVDPDAKTVDFSAPGSDYHPGPNHLDNQRYAAHEAQVAAEAGDLEGARRWAEAASAMGAPVERQRGRLHWVRDRLERAAAWFSKQKIGEKFKVKLDDFVDLSWRRGAGNSTADDLIAEADFLRLKGDWEGASRQYRAAIASHGLERGTLAGAEPALKKLHIVEEAIRTRKLLPDEAVRKVAWQTYGRPTEDMIETAARQSKHVEPVGDSLNEVFPIVLGEQDYALKRISVARLLSETGLNAEQAEEAVEKMMRSEVAAAALGDLFGVPVPPCAARLTRDAEGRIAGDLLSPWVAGPDLQEETIGRLLAVKDQYAEHRVFSMLLGDYDRHLGNYKLVNGTLVTLDCGQGQIMRWPDSMTQGRIDEMNTWIVDHWYSRRKNAIKKNHKMLEQSLVHQDMAPAFDRAREVFRDRAPEVRERLRKAMGELYGDDAIRAGRAADDAFDIMKGRLDWLEDRVKKFNADRNGLPLDVKLTETGCVRPLRADPPMRRAA